MGVGEAEAQAGACAAEQAEASRLGGDSAGALCQCLAVIGEDSGALTLGGLWGQGPPSFSFPEVYVCWGMHFEENGSCCWWGGWRGRGVLR